MATDIGLTDWHDAVLRNDNSGHSNLLPSGNMGRNQRLGASSGANACARVPESSSSLS